jgi:hypothetical protein
MNYYCGNNRLNRELLNNTKILGTRYKCLQIGIGKGLNLPLDNDYLGDYDPIDDTKIYCGKKEDLPENYDKFGSLSECLRKGVGIGKRQKALNEDGGDIVLENNYINNYINKYIIYFIIEILLFIILYNFTPKFLKKDKNKHKELNIYKFIFFYFFVSFIIFLVFYNF